jgi:MOSC domain-containing protein YiiM
MIGSARGKVIGVSRSEAHTFSKTPCESIRLVAGVGVDGDAHGGTTVKHRSRVRRDPTQPNLRQVHLLHAELLDELNDAGFGVAPAQLGENVTTRGVDLLRLPQGARLHVGREVVVAVTGIRNPCVQLDEFRPGLLEAVLVRHANGVVERKTGVMGVVLVGGEIQPGDAIDVELPAPPHVALGVI